jgi:hypothetical protein
LEREGTVLLSFVGERIRSEEKRIEKEKFCMA